MSSDGSGSVAQATDPPAYTHVKLLVVGDSGTGKTSLLQRLAKDLAPPPENMCTPTLGVDFVLLNVVRHGRPVKLWCWDMAGQDRYYSMVNQYWQNTDVALLCYDMSKPGALKSLFANWVQPAKGKLPPHCQIVLVGCKQDEIHAHHADEVQQQAEAVLATFGQRALWTSARHDPQSKLLGMLYPYVDRELGRPRPADPGEAIDLASPAGEGAARQSCSFFLGSFARAQRVDERHCESEERGVYPWLALLPRSPLLLVFSVPSPLPPRAGAGATHEPPPQYPPTLGKITPAQEEEMHLDPAHRLWPLWLLLLGWLRATDAGCPYPVQCPTQEEACPSVVCPGGATILEITTAAPQDTFVWPLWPPAAPARRRRQAQATVPTSFTVDWGDSSPPTPCLDAGAAPCAHTYAAPGTYTVTADPGGRYPVRGWALTVTSSWYSEAAIAKGKVGTTLAYLLRASPKPASSSLV
eukprot:g70888.t1